MRLDKDFFRKITQNRMSPMATQQEQSDFYYNLPKKINYEDMQYLRERDILRTAYSYDYHKVSDLAYIAIDNNPRTESTWYLYMKESNYIYKNILTGELINITNINSLNWKEVSYIRKVSYYKFNTRGLPTGFKWSRIRSKNINYVNDYLKPNILARYAMFNRPTNGLSNVLIDSFVPKLMYQHNFDISYMRMNANLPATALTISPWFSALFQTKQIEVEQMARILGYTKKDLKNLLVAVKKQQHKVAFIGYGGTNVNTIHWITEMCSLTHTLHPFRQVSIYEPDVLEMSNMFRFPKNPEAIISDIKLFRTKKHSKLALLTDYELKTLSKTKPHLSNSRIGSYELRHDGNVKNSIIYGAPSLSTREAISIENVRFLSATHTGNSCYIHSNPIQDGELQVETYGLIQLSIFFMNQLKLAISFLEILANNDIDLYAKDVEHLNYTFTQDNSLTTDRKYNFQLDHDGHMVTEEEANAVV